MTTLTCEHCESEIDVANDRSAVDFSVTGHTDVMCEACRELAYHRWQASLTLPDGPAGVGDLNLPKADQRGCEALREAYAIKRGWRT